MPRQPQTAERSRGRENPVDFAMDWPASARGEEGGMGAEGFIPAGLNTASCCSTRMTPK